VQGKPPGKTAMDFTGKVGKGAMDAKQQKDPPRSLISDQRLRDLRNKRKSQGRRRKAEVPKETMKLGAQEGRDTETEELNLVFKKMKMSRYYLQLVG